MALFKRGSTVQGTVSKVQLGDTLNGTGGTVQVTFVTFLQGGTPLTIGFCGDQNQSVSAQPNCERRFQSRTTLRDCLIIVTIV